MYAWSENRVIPERFGDTEAIVNTTESYEFATRPTGNHRNKVKWSSVTGPTCNGDRGTTTFAERFRDFGSSTTFHGVSHVTNYKHNGIRRFIWFLIVVGMASVLIGSITRLVIDFYQYPTTSSITINYVKNMTFPAVTLCNFNQYRKSLLLPEELEFFTKIYGDIHVGEIEDIDVSALDYVEDMEEGDVKKLLLNLTHQLETMLVACSWRGVEKCTSRNFTIRFTDHGICFTFNDPDDPADRLQVRNAGSKNGMFLRLYAEADEYIFGENTATGFRIMLHPQGVVPLVKELGFSVSPGFESSVAVRQNVVKSLSSPYQSNCTNSELRYGGKYTVPTCRYECKIKYVVDRCGCRDYRWPGGARLCRPSEHFNCLLRFIEEFQKKDVECPCPVSCETKTFDSRISMGFWPSGHVTDYLASAENFTEEYVRKNYLDVYIFFEELMYIEIEQKPALPMLTLQSNVGGYMGLVCGMSLITILEWMDFLLISVLRKCRLA